MLVYKYIYIYMYICFPKYSPILQLSVFICCVSTFHSDFSDFHLHGFRSYLPLFCTPYPQTDTFSALCTFLFHLSLA